YVVPADGSPELPNPITARTRYANHYPRGNENVSGRLIDVGTPAECDKQPNISELDGLLTRKEVMSLLNIAKCTYTRWIEQGILVPRIFGKRHFFSEADLGRAMKESIRKGKRSSNGDLVGRFRLTGNIRIGVFPLRCAVLPYEFAGHPHNFVALPRHFSALQSQRDGQPGRTSVHPGHTSVLPSLTNGHADRIAAHLARLSVVFAHAPAMENDTGVQPS